MKTRSFTKLLSLVLVLMMVISTMVIVPLTTNAASEAVQPAGTGTEAEPYEITSAGNLVWVKSNLASAGTQIGDTTNRLIYMNLMNDVTVDAGFRLVTGNWDTGSTYEWHIDGQGHALSGLTKSFMGGTGAGSVFENLTIANSTVTLDDGNAGILVGYARGAATFTNCKLAATVTGNGASGKNHVGGFVGSTSTALTFIGCVNEATINSTRNAGGFMGANNQATTFTNCVNSGTIKGQGHVGGFIGLAESDSDIVFNNCINEGTVTSTSGQAGAFAGGGRAKQGALNLNDCYNVGTINADTLAPASEGKAVTINNSAKTLDEVRAGLPVANDITPENTSVWDGTTITKPAQGDGSEVDPYVIESAANLAWFASNNTVDCPTTSWYAILECNVDLNDHSWKGIPCTADQTLYFDGQGYTIKQLNANVNYSSGFFGVGKGVINVSDLHFVDCHAKDTASTSGIVISYVLNASNVTNVTVAADCTVTAAKRAGGIMGTTGWSHTKMTTITNCYVAATVKATSNSFEMPAGGFVGYIEITAAPTLTMTDCLFEGTVAAEWESGDIVGFSKSNLTFTNVYSTNTYSELYKLGLSTKTPVLDNTYTAAEVADPANADAVKAIAMMGIADLGINDVAEVRLKLTDDFGFMAIASLKNATSTNALVTYGMYLSTEAVADAADLVENGTKIQGAVYNGSATDVYAAYTELTAATLDTQIWFVLYAEINGVIVTADTVETINCAELAEDLSLDGKIGETVVTTNAAEIAMYVQMVKYHKAYKAYLDSVTPA